MRWWLTSIFLLVCIFQVAESNDSPSASFSLQATNNWAVLVCTSRWWYNYRHVANVLSIYRTVKRLGIPDRQIILMLADDMACDPRNPEPGSVFNSNKRDLNLYGQDVEVDYRGYEVTVEAFIRLLTGRHHPSTPASQRLMTDASSNVLVYMSGHGGDEFLKFQDASDIKSQDIADAFEQMRLQGRYRQVMFMVDTCQANTLFNQFYSPGIFAIGSSAQGENSYSHQVDSYIGAAVVDRFTFHTLAFLETVNVTSSTTLADLLRTYSFPKLGSNAGWRTDLFGRRPSDVRLTEFFGAVHSLQHLVSLSDLPPRSLQL